MKTSDLLRRAKGRFERGYGQVDTAGYAIHSVARNADEEIEARKFLYLANPTTLQRFDRAITLAEAKEAEIESCCAGHFLLQQAEAEAEAERAPIGGDSKNGGGD